MARLDGVRHSTGSFPHQNRLSTRPGQGEIIGDELMNIVNSELEDKVVLDVRSAAETNPDKLEKIATKAQREAFG